METFSEVEQFQGTRRRVPFFLLSMKGKYLKMIDAFTGMSLWVVDSEGNLLTYGPLRLERKLYPVGQGSFYAERFMDGDICKACVVYDCGSMQEIKKKNKTQKEIDCWIDELLSKQIIYQENKPTIDILFISHFHEDHVNGISQLIEKYHIKLVMMPFLESMEKDMLFLLEWCHAGMRNDNDEATYNLYKLIYRPESLFDKETVITYVRAYDNLTDSDKNVKAIDIKDVKESSNINSFTPITCVIDAPKGSKNPYIWKYVPFYMGLGEEYNNFKSAFEDSNTLHDVIQGNACLLGKLYDGNFQKEVRTVYECITKKRLNEYSLMVYSGPLDNDLHFNVKYSLGKNMCSKKKEQRTLENSVAGCLYLGDAKLGWGPKMLNGKKCDTIRIIKEKLKSDLPQLDMVQVPHHGSADSYSSKLLELNAKTEHYFVSYGKINRYGHPSSDVVKDIASQGKLLSCVTEDKKSLCTISYHFPEKVWGKPEEKGTSDAPQAN